MPQHLEAALGLDGRADAWLHRTVIPPIEAMFQPNVVYGNGGELGQGVIDMPWVPASAGMTRYLG